MSNDDTSDNGAGAPAHPPAARRSSLRAVIDQWTDDEWADAKAIVRALLDAPPLDPGQPGKPPVLPWPPLRSPRTRAVVDAWDIDDWEDAAAVLAGLTAGELTPAVMALHARVQATADRVITSRQAAVASSGQVVDLPPPAVERYDTAQVMRMTRSELVAAASAAHHIEPSVLDVASDDELRIRLKGRPRRQVTPDGSRGKR